LLLLGSERRLPLQKLDGEFGEDPLRVTFAEIFDVTPEGKLSDYCTIFEFSHQLTTYRMNSVKEIYLASLPLLY
jgi:hypothetical protein